MDLTAGWRVIFSPHIGGRAVTRLSNPCLRLPEPARVASEWGVSKAVYGTALSTHSSTQDLPVILSPKTLWLSEPEGPERNIKETRETQVFENTGSLHPPTRHASKQPSTVRLCSSECHMSTLIHVQVRGRASLFSGGRHYVGVHDDAVECTFRLPGTSTSVDSCHLLCYLPYIVPPSSYS